MFFCYIMCMCIAVRIGRRLSLGLSEPSLDFIMNHGFVATVTVKVKENASGESNDGISLFVLSLESPVGTFSKKKGLSFVDS